MPQNILNDGEIEFLSAWALEEWEGSRSPISLPAIRSCLPALI